MFNGMGPNWCGRGKWIICTGIFFILMFYQLILTLFIFTRFNLFLFMFFLFLLFFGFFRLIW